MECIINILEFVLFCGKKIEEEEQQARPFRDRGRQHTQISSVSDGVSSLKTPLLSETVGSLKPTKVCRPSPLITSVHDRSAAKSPHKFRASDSSPLKNPKLSKTVDSLKPIKIFEDRDQRSGPSPLIGSIHDQSETVGSLKPVKLSEGKLVWDNPSFSITVPVIISLEEKQTVNQSPFGGSPHVAKTINKSNVKDLLVSLSPLTSKSVSVSSTESFQNRPILVQSTQKHIKSDPVKISQEEKQTINPSPFGGSPHVSKTINKSNVKDLVVNSSPLTSKSVSVSSTESFQNRPPLVQSTEKHIKSGPVKLSQEEKQAIYPSPFGGSPHVSKTIFRSDVKDLVVNSSPLMSKSVSVSSAESFQNRPILVQSTQKHIKSDPVKISQEEKQTINQSPFGGSSHVSKSIKKSNVNDLVVNSSLLTSKSVSVSSTESLQNHLILVQSTQNHIKSDEKEVVHSLLPKKIWVKKSLQQVETDGRAKPISILLDKDPTVSSSVGLSASKKYAIESSESPVGNEIDEESLQLPLTVPRKKYKLPVYPIPKHLKDFIEEDKVPEVLRKPLSPATYTDYFAALLYAEDFYNEKWADFLLSDVTLELHEEQAKKETGNSNMSCSYHVDKKVFVKFEIDSVPERRPYLLSRDFVFLKHSGKPSRTFEGSLIRVMKSTHVLAEFEDDFYSQYSPNDRYDVSFSFNRVCLKRCHQAVASAMDPSFRHVLFPNKFCVDSFSSVSSCSVVDKITTVQGAPPYLIEGPLEVVVVIVRKAVLQICRNSPTCRILICAAKNKTCDTLIASLNGEIPESELFRANAAFREFLDLDDNVIPLSSYDGECFITPSLSELKQFRVVTATYVSSFRLHCCGITAGHFTHIFLVDASRATEPESMIALANLVGEKTAIVVSGWTGTHPPRVRSDIARRNGLKRSYFHRLLESYRYSSRDSFFAAHLN